MDEQYPRRYVIHLWCGCRLSALLPVPPVIGGDRHCYVHGVGTRIIEIDPEYNSKCLDCRSYKTFGVALLQAKMFADRHSRSKPTHRVQVRRGNEILETRVPKTLLNELPFQLDEPPF